MADVGGLVRVDVGVLDDDLALFGSERGPAGDAHGLGHGGALVEPEVEEPAAGDLGLDDAFDRRQQGSRLLSDDAGRLPELLGQLEREGQGQVAHARVRRRGHVELFGLDWVDGPQPVVNSFF